MYEILNNILYHIDGFINFCYADSVYSLLLILLQMTVIVCIVEIIGLHYQRKQDKG
ncbi:MAG: hypothetical protein J6K43_06130 [Lachnospiraceae bacterium]|nr:hypothetical protein [Lachnospiraceae bacterium]